VTANGTRSKVWAQVSPQHTHTTTHCNALQVTATHYSTLQRTTTHCNTLHRKSKVWAQVSLFQICCQFLVALSFISHICTRGPSVCIYTYWVVTISSLLQKLYVSFAEYDLFYRALFKKRPIILRSLLIVAIPYMYV